VKKPKNPKQIWAVVDVDGGVREACRKKREAERSARELDSWTNFAPIRVVKYVLAEAPDAG